MEEKKGIKISLGTVICLIVITVLVMLLFGVCYYYNNVKIVKIEDSTEKNNTSIDIANKENEVAENNINLSDVIESDSKYAEITKKLEGIDCLYVTDVVSKDNEYTLKGVIYTQYTISENEYENIIKNEQLSINGKNYRLDFANNELNLHEENNEYDLYKIKRLNSEQYYLECQAQLSDVWKLTDKYMQITVNGDISVPSSFSPEEKTVEETFKNYTHKEATDTANPEDKCTYNFEFENGKCVEVIDYPTNLN